MTLDSQRYYNISNIWVTSAPLLLAISFSDVHKVFKAICRHTRTHNHARAQTTDSIRYISNRHTYLRICDDRVPTATATGINKLMPYGIICVNSICLRFWLRLFKRMQIAWNTKTCCWHCLSVCCFVFILHSFFCFIPKARRGIGFCMVLLSILYGTE